MKIKMIYVIRDQNGNFISPKQLKRGWYYTTYTGDCTGFTYYSNRDTAEFEVNELNKLNNNQFSLEYIDFKSIPSGKRINNTKKVCLTYK
jgi:hypothetical protein